MALPPIKPTPKPATPLLPDPIKQNAMYPKKDPAYQTNELKTGTSPQAATDAMNAQQPQIDPQITTRISHKGIVGVRQSDGNPTLQTHMLNARNGGNSGSGPGGGLRSGSSGSGIDWIKANGPGRYAAQGGIRQAERNVANTGDASRMSFSDELKQRNAADAAAAAAANPPKKSAYGGMRNMLQNWMTNKIVPASQPTRISVNGTPAEKNPLLGADRTAAKNTAKNIARSQIWRADEKPPRARIVDDLEISDEERAKNAANAAAFYPKPGATPAAPRQLIGAAPPSAPNYDPRYPGVETQPSPAAPAPATPTPAAPRQLIGAAPPSAPNYDPRYPGVETQREQPQGQVNPSTYANVQPDVPGTANGDPLAAASTNPYPVVPRYSTPNFAPQETADPFKMYDRRPADKFPAQEQPPAQYAPARSTSPLPAQGPPASDPFQSFGTTQPGSNTLPMQSVPNAVAPQNAPYAAAEQTPRSQPLANPFQSFGTTQTGPTGPPASAAPAPVAMAPVPAPPVATASPPAAPQQLPPFVPATFASPDNTGVDQGYVPIRNADGSPIAPRVSPFAPPATQAPQSPFGSLVNGAAPAPPVAPPSNQTLPQLEAQMPPGSVIKAGPPPSPPQYKQPGQGPLADTADRLGTTPGIQPKFIPKTADPFQKNDRRPADKFPRQRPQLTPAQQWLFGQSRLSGSAVHP